MAKSLFGGMTDYSNQSLADILCDIEREKNNTAACIESIGSNLDKLNANRYWSNKVPSDFKSIVSYSLQYFETVVTELTDIFKDLNIEVRENHIQRLLTISQVAQEINMNIGKIWNQDYHLKEYGDASFKTVENIYGDTRNMAVNLLDASNIAERLKDFVGKKADSVSKKKFKLEFGHKLTILSIIIASLVLLFGNNIIGRFNDKTSDFRPSAREWVDSSKEQSTTKNNPQSLLKDTSVTTIPAEKKIRQDTGLQEIKRKQVPSDIIINKSPNSNVIIGNGNNVNN